MICEPVIQPWLDKYAATEEKHDARRNLTSEVPVDKQISRHAALKLAIFSSLAPNIADPMKCAVQGPGRRFNSLCSAVHTVLASRVLLAAIIEASHDEAGIIWPESVAPFQNRADQFESWRRLKRTKPANRYMNN